MQSCSRLALSDEGFVFDPSSGDSYLVNHSGLFILKAFGQGDVIFGSFGAIHEVQVDGHYSVDTGHIVAFDSTLTFNIRRVGGLKSLFLSGEGLICDFQGKGRLYIQTRKPASFVHWINMFRPVQQSDGGSPLSILGLIKRFI